MIAQSLSTGKKPQAPESNRLGTLFVTLVNILIALCVFAISYNLIFPEGSDRSRYERSFQRSIDDPTGFGAYFFTTDRPKIAFYALMYQASKTGMTVDGFIAALNAITVFVILHAFSLLDVKRFRYLLFVILVISCLNATLFSGVRYYFSLSFFTMFLATFAQQKYFYALSCLLISSIFHVSFAVFFLVFLPVFHSASFSIAAGIILLVVGQILRLVNPFEVIDHFSSRLSHSSVSSDLDKYVEMQGFVHRHFLYYILRFWFILPVFIYAVLVHSHKLASVLALNLLLMVAFAANYQVFARLSLPLFVTFIFILGLHHDRRDYVYFLCIAGVAALINLILDIHARFDVYRSLVD